MVRAISVYSAGVPYAGRAICSALYCSGKNPATLGYVSVLEFSFDRKLSESYFVGLWIKQRLLNYRRNA